MSARELLQRYLDECPLIGIVRGVTPSEAEAIAGAILEGGIRIIEVPLNSACPVSRLTGFGISGVPPWWPAFCATYDVGAAGFLAYLLIGSKLPPQPRLSR